MAHSAHAGHHAHAAHGHAGTPSLDRIAFLATLHCLAGCAVGEIAGMVVGTAMGLSNGETIALAVLLAFMSGYTFTMFPLLRAGYAFKAASALALAADTASIAVMEIVDNLVMLAIPGAMDAPLSSLLFWVSLAAALGAAGAIAFPVNRWLIARGKGHAVAHAHH
jgi:hypothetical protein